jgi:ribonuclease HI
MINTDSKYVKDGITKWITTWKTNNYKTQSNTDVLNKGMWLIFDSLNSDRKDIKMKGS